jgi:uncharacterized protein involved in tolerance to divalent cations
MILLHILTKTEEQAVEIADLLIEQKLILNAVILDQVRVRQMGDGGSAIKSEKEYLLMGKSKALLFSTIDERLRLRYPKDLPTIYAVPIVGMDWEQADELVEKTAKI